MQIVPVADRDPEHNFMVANTSTILKKIIMFQNGKPKCDTVKLYSRQQKFKAL